MKKSTKNNKKVLATVAILILVLLAVLFSRNWLSANRQKEQLKHTLSGELHKLENPLKAMGFDISKVKSECQNGASNSTYCSASINSYTVINNSPNNLKDYAIQLSGLLDKNGWHQREDYRTISWFENIRKGVDYQPDQLNTKRVASMDCTLDFFTSFSKPKPAAVTLSAVCATDNPPPFVID